MTKHNNNKKQRGGSDPNIAKPTSTGTSWSLMPKFEIPAFLSTTKPPANVETKSSENDEKTPPTNVETKPPANVETNPPAGQKSFWNFWGGKKSKKTKRIKKSKKSKTQKRH